MQDELPHKSAAEPVVVEVMPIVKGITKPALSYFSTESFSPGSFVRIPVRSGEAPAIVMRSIPARNAKADVKGASFVLKKLSRLKSDAVLSSSFMKALEMTAEYYGATPGSTLNALLPKIFLESPELIGTHDDHKEKKKEATAPEPFVIQLEDDERFQEYKSIIRENFARKSSVLFIVPTHEEALRACDILARGIEDYTFLTSKKSPLKLRATLKEAQECSHSILFITTPAYLAFDRGDITTIIFEKENSRAYRTLARPFLHPKVFLRFFAKESERTLILGDSILSIETLWREKEGDYAELSPLKWRQKSGAMAEVIDMKSKRGNDRLEPKEFAIISTEVRHMIEEAVREKRKVFLFGARKGLAPSTVCSDCGSILPCQNCGAPVVLYEKKDSKTGRKEPLYICHACGAKRDPLTRCDNCSSWRLVPLGIGVDRIAKEAEKMFPNTPVYILDKDHAPTRSQAETIMKKFAGEKGGILVGTELAFLYLEKIPYSAVISLDSLFAIPDFAIHERVFSIVSRLKEITDSKFIVQTRNIGRNVLEFAKDGNVLDFYREEIKEREELFYPPFSIFVKVWSEDTREDVRGKAAYLQSLFSDWEPDYIEERGKKAGRTAVSMILRLPRSSWPNKEVVKRLLSLSPEFLIKVDPESIL